MIEMVYITEKTDDNGKTFYAVSMDHDLCVSGERVVLLFENAADAIRMYHYLNGGEPDCDVLKFLKTCSKAQNE